MDEGTRWAEGRHTPSPSADDASAQEERGVEGHVERAAPFEAAVQTEERVQAGEVHKEVGSFPAFLASRFQTPSRHSSLSPERLGELDAVYLDAPVGKRT